MTAVRVLALDYGSARCGCALSDATGTLATPIEPVASPGTARGLDTLAALVADRQAERVVVGLPLSLSGADSAQTAEARGFASRLAERLGPAIPVELYDERFTTRLARRPPHGGPGRAGGGRTSEDSRAAAHLLESWLHAKR